MNTTETEKDWLRHISGQKHSDTAEFSPKDNNIGLRKTQQYYLIRNFVRTRQVL